MTNINIHLKDFEKIKAQRYEDFTTFTLENKTQDITFFVYTDDDIVKLMTVLTRMLENTNEGKIKEVHL